jgi:hypothetical protein
MSRLKTTLGLAGLFFLGSCLSMQAAITCTTADYKGTWAFYTSGAFVQLPPAAAVLQGPFAQSGIFTSDGQGNVIIQSNASYNGLILPATVPATYVINSDCTIEFSLFLPAPLGVPTTFRGVLTNNLRNMSLVIDSPPGTVVIGNHYKQDTQFCGPGTLHGAYGIDLGGILADGSAQAGRYQKVGRMVADGVGNFSAVTIANYNGQSVEEDFSGTYNVTGDCGLTLNFNLGAGKALTLGGYLGGHGDVATLMVMTKGWAVSGTIKAQQP